MGARGSNLQSEVKLPSESRRLRSELGADLPPSQMRKPHPHPKQGFPPQTRGSTGQDFMFGVCNQGPPVRHQRILEEGPSPSRLRFLICEMGMLRCVVPTMREPFNSHRVCYTLRQMWLAQGPETAEIRRQEHRGSPASKSFGTWAARGIQCSTEQGRGCYRESAKDQTVVTSTLPSSPLSLCPTWGSGQEPSRQ